MHSHKFFALLSIALLAVSLGCGGTGAKTTSNPANPSPTPSPNSPDDFMVTLMVANGHNTQSQGTVTVDATANNGAGNLQLTGSAVAGTAQTETLRFCPAANTFNNCANGIAVVTFTTDQFLRANVNFTFPQKGTFSGFFDVVQGGTAQVLLGQPDTFAPGTAFQATFLPQGSNSGEGTITITGQNVHVALMGGIKNHLFQVNECGSFSSCTLMGNLTTDAMGNGTVDITLNTAVAGTLWVLADGNGMQYVTGFRVQ
jgi:hypothetical protein